ncbi:AAA family ATPase [Guyparkeria sp. 1SP6A2]|nr:AAA family ATPase [Guyparkeria sp. 1SP6A2]
MKLSKIKIEKFKRINRIEIGTGPLNILVGSNGSGKSSVLQAAHLASCLLRQAGRIRTESTSTVAVMDLDYLPTDDYSRLGHGASWGNKANTPSSKITFTFEDDGGDEIAAICEARAARNAGISVTGHIPDEVRSSFRGSDTYFSGFIPGISGVPNSEQKQSKRVVMKACSFGDSNVILRNALDLLSDGEIRQLEIWLSRLMGEVSIKIGFQPDRDLTIKSEVEVDGVLHPIELLGTGYIQLIQIFCYILLFKPKILLIDEPDIHLHPNVQEKLATTLSDIAAEKSFSVILTTHSPFIVRGSPINANVYWLDNGGLANDSREAAEIALGWGAFGKKVVIVSEDKDISLFKKLVGQWPELEKFVTFHPGQGYRNLMSPEQAQDLYETLGRQYKILVHRDRDSLTDEEVIRLKRSYSAEGVELWCTELSDIEAYFCSSEFISDLLGCDITLARDYIDQVLNQHDATGRQQFEGQRKAHNQEFYPDGGSPLNDEVWRIFQNRELKGFKGKFVFNQLKNKIPGGGFSEAEILDHYIDAELAVPLKETIRSMVEEE